MAQSSSSSTLEYKNDNGVVCLCKCPTKILKAWIDENPGRRFYTCGRGRKVLNGYESCNFFRWFDLEKSHGWQYFALLEARDHIREQKEEIRKLRDTINELMREGQTEDMKISSDFADELKNSRDECVMLKQGVLILKEKNKGLRNVIITSSVGFAVVIGVMLAMWK